MASWPNYGRILVAGHRQQPRPNNLRTEMESGVPKQEAGSARVRLEHRIRVRFTADEYASFKTWWRDTIAHGTGWFDWDDPEDGANKQARIVRGEFSASPERVARGQVPDWVVELTLETWDA